MTEERAVCVFWICVFSCAGGVFRGYFYKSAAEREASVCTGRNSVYLMRRVGPALANCGLIEVDRVNVLVCTTVCFNSVDSSMRANNGSGLKAFTSFFKEEWTFGLDLFMRNSGSVPNIVSSLMC